MLQYPIEKIKLPPLNTWLSPNYEGPGLLEQELLLKTVGGYDDPKEWKSTYSDYMWKVEPMMGFKFELHDALNPLDEINSDENDDKIYYQASHKLNPYFPLKGNQGIIKEQFNAEVVTNAWLKMFELCIFLEPLLKKIKKSKNKKIHSLSIAELPGNFVLAIHHWKENNFPSIDWTWSANSYRQLYTSEHGYLQDQYGLMRNYPDNWDFGTTGDGDITDVDNIVGYSRKKYHFSTGDVKYVRPDMDYSQEENINLPVVWGQFLCSISGLEKDGVVILKMFTFFESATLCLHAVASHCFKDAYITKPLNSRPANTEIYLVCVGYKQNLSSLQWKNLLNYMNYIRFLNDGSDVPSLFKNLPDKFLSTMTNIANELKNKQIDAFNHNINIFKDIKEHGFNKIKKLHEDKQLEISENFIKDIKIQPLINPMRR